MSSVRVRFFLDHTQQIYQKKNLKERLRTEQGHRRSAEEGS